MIKHTLSSSAKADDPVFDDGSAITGCPAGACHRAGHFGPDPLAWHDDV